MQIKKFKDMSISELKKQRTLAYWGGLIIFILSALLGMLSIFKTTEPLVVFGIIGLGTGSASLCLVMYSHAGLEIRLKDFERECEQRRCKT